MPKITSVEPQKKNPKRFNIFLDGDFAFGADEDLVVEYRLITGKELNTDLVDELLFEAEVGKLMERMYSLFNIRQRTEKEVRTYLKNLSFKRKVKDKDEISDQAIESLIKKLKQKRLLNDAEFAKAWVESRRKTKQKGRIALRAELFQKGVDREIVEEALEIDEESEMHLAGKALEKYLEKLKGLPDFDKRKKAYQFLMRRGFEYGIVSDVVEKMLKFGYNDPRGNQ